VQLLRNVDLGETLCGSAKRMGTDKAAPKWASGVAFCLDAAGAHSCIDKC
jgi:hypothetical protein